MVLNSAEVLTAKGIAKQDEKLNYNLRMLLGQIIYTNNLRGAGCYTHNAHFAKFFNRSERTIKRWLKILKDLGYISIKYVWEGTKIVNRLISISAEFLAKILDKIHKKAREAENGVGKPNVPGNGLVSNKVNTNNKNIHNNKVNTNNKISADKIFKKSKPGNYDELLNFWADKKLESSPKDFWNYNAKREWAGIRNWKRAARGWARKAKDNLAAFKANKTKDKQTTLDYLDILPELSYNSWDIL